MFAVMPFYWLGLQQQCLPQLTPCSQRSALAGNHRKKGVLLSRQDDWCGAPWKGWHIESKFQQNIKIPSSYLMNANQLEIEHLIFPCQFQIPPAIQSTWPIMHARCWTRGPDHRRRHWWRGLELRMLDPKEEHSRGGRVTSCTSLQPFGYKFEGQHIGQKRLSISRGIITQAWNQWQWHAVDLKPL